MFIPGRFGRPSFVPTKPVVNDPVSDIIGLSALISSLSGGALAVTVGATVGAASVIGGALVGVPPSRVVHLRARR